MAKTRVAVLFGGVSSEHEVSLMSATNVIRSIPKEKYEVICIGITKKGRWLYFPGDVSEIASGAWETNPDCTAAIISPDPIHKGIITIENGETYNKKIDVVFPVLHGRNGEDGRLQGLLELAKLPYVGCGTLSSALCMDKSITKEMFRCYHVPTPAGITVRSEEELILPEDFTYPCMVKTCCGGSSVGVYRVENEDELHVALKEAFTYEDHVIIEKCIIGREFSIAVVEGKALPVIEIAPLTGFYDYKNKYQAGSTIETCPADLPSEVAKRMQQHAEEACAAVSIQSYARVDFMLDTVTMEDYALEVNTLPGMTPTSLMPQEAQALGLSFDDLCEWILAVSLKKYK